LNRFLEAVLGNPEHELYEPAMAGELSYASTHLQPVTVRTEPVIS
jgi:hypothetical protein